MYQQPGMEKDKKTSKLQDFQPKVALDKRKKKEMKIKIPPVKEYKPPMYDIRKYREYKSSEYKPLRKMDAVRRKVIVPYDIKQYDYHYEYDPDFLADKDGPPVQSIKKKYEKTDLVEATKNNLISTIAGFSFAAFKMKKRLGDKRAKEAAALEAKEAEALEETRNLFSRVGGDPVDEDSNRRSVYKLNKQKRHKQFLLSRPQMEKGFVPEEW